MTPTRTFGASRSCRKEPPDFFATSEASRLARTNLPRLSTRHRKSVCETWLTAPFFAGQVYLDASCPRLPDHVGGFQIRNPVVNESSCFRLIHLYRAGWGTGPRRSFETGLIPCRALKGYRRTFEHKPSRIGNRRESNRLDVVSLGHSPLGGPVLGGDTANVSRYRSWQLQQRHLGASHTLLKAESSCNLA